MYRLYKLLVYVGIMILLAGSLVMTVPGSAKAATTKVSSVELNYHTYVLKPRQSVKLQTTCLPKEAKNRSVNWKSSKPSVASVSAKGKVNAKKKGTAKITATAKDGSKKKAVCTIKVVSSIKKIKKITLKANGTNVIPGDKVTLKSKLKPNKVTLKSLKWESSNTAVATVDQKGVVMAVAPGEVKITAKAQDGSKKKGTIKMTVRKVPITELLLSEKTKTMREGKTLQLFPSIVPTNATNKILEWSSSDTSVVKTDATGKILAVGIGNATVTAKTTDGTGISVSCEIQVLPAVVLANQHGGSEPYSTYEYRLDRHATQYQRVYREEGKEAVSYLKASDVSGAVFKWSMYLNKERGITSKEKFCRFVDTLCKENMFEIFGFGKLDMKEYTSDYSEITLQTADGEKEMHMRNIQVIESQTSITDPNGLSTKASRIQMTIAGEELIMEIYDNGSKIAIYRPTYSGAQFEFYQDNADYTYVMRMTKFLNGILMDELDTMPNLRYMDMYNLY